MKKEREMSEREDQQRLIEAINKDATIAADVRLFQQEVEDALVWGYAIGEDPRFVLASLLAEETGNE